EDGEFVGVDMKRIAPGILRRDQLGVLHLGIGIKLAPVHDLFAPQHEPIVGIWQRHRKIKEKESNIYDPNRPPSAGSTGRWIHNPQLPPLHSFTIAFRPKSLVKTSTVTLNLIYTDLRKAPNLNSHSTKSLITSCMS